MSFVYSDRASNESLTISMRFKCTTRLLISRA
jgi:hypothetical protein